MKRPLHLRFNRLLPFLLAIAASFGSVRLCLAQTSEIPDMQWNPDQELTITNWAVLGPFHADVDRTWDDVVSHWSDEDPLGTVGTSEGDLNWVNHVTFPKRAGSVQGGPKWYPESLAPSSVLALRDIPGMQFPGIVYAAVRVISPTDSKAFLLTGSGDGIKAWVNGQPVLVKDNFRSIETYSDVTNIELHKGPNLLVVKLRHRGANCRLTARLASANVMWTHVIPLAPYSVRPFKSLILTHGDFLSFDPALFTVPAKVQMFDISGVEVRSWNIGGDLATHTLSLAGLSLGWYRVDVSVGSFILSRPLFFGKPLEEAVTEYDSEIHALLKRPGLNRDEVQRRQLDTDVLLQRYRHLLKQPPREADRLLWQHKLLFVIRDLETIRANLKNGVVAPLRGDGYHLGAYRSKIDGAEQPFLLYLPREVHGALPLVVMVPFATQPTRPFIESIHLADHIELAERAALADKYGFALLWYGGRGESFGSDIEATDFQEALAAVRSEHDIDPEKIYLMGACAGARQAIRLAARFPNDIAAISLVSPETDPGWGGPRDGAPEARRAAVRWLALSNPQLLVSNISHIPTRLECLKFDAHASLQQCVKYARIASQFGQLTRYEVVDDPLDSYLDRMFAFLKDKKQTKVNEQTAIVPRLRYAPRIGSEIVGLQDWSRPGVASITYHDGKPKLTGSTNILVSNGQPVTGSDNSQGMEDQHALRKTANSEGPIMHAFAGHFIVVRPKEGDLGNSGGWGAIANKLNNRWRTEYFCDLQIRDDTEVSSADINDANLILVGTPENNAALRAVWNRLPVAISSGGIRFFSHDFSGPAVGIEFIYPNPANPSRYIVVLTGSQPSAFDHHELSLSQSGWYDFAVWSVVGGKEQVLSWDWFDGLWQPPAYTAEKAQQLRR